MNIKVFSGFGVCVSQIIKTNNSLYIDYEAQLFQLTFWLHFTSSPIHLLFVLLSIYVLL